VVVEQGHAHERIRFGFINRHTSPLAIPGNFSFVTVEDSFTAIGQKSTTSSAKAKSEQSD